MILLSLETSTRQPTAAIFREGTWLKSIGADSAPGPGSARFPLQIRELLRSQDVSPRDLNAIAVSIGPGSFTGLRIGVVLAKTWAWATKCPVIAVDTLESIAMGAVEEYAIPRTCRVHVLVDAHRNQFFRGLYHHAESGLVKSGETEIIEIGDVRNGTTQGDWLAGPGLSKPAFVDVSKNGFDLNLAPIQPDAKLTGILAWKMFQAGQVTDPFGLVPQYVRQSAAEEKSASLSNQPQ